MKRTTYLKRYWPDEDILFYLHFDGSEVIRQIEVSPSGQIMLSKDNPIQGESMLYDQIIEDIDLGEFETISEQDFNEVWKSNNKW